MQLSEIARLLGGQTQGDAGLEITGVAGLPDAAGTDISFITHRRQAPEATRSAAGCIMLKDFIKDIPKAQLKVPNPQVGFAKLLAHFHPARHPRPGISPLAFVEEGAELGKDVSVGPFAVVSRGVKIGPNSIIYPNVFVGEQSSLGASCIVYPGVVIRDGISVGDRVIIHPNAVIGADGFGYAQTEEGLFKIPQPGGVIIGDDVEIGAGTTIDRATTGFTEIGRGTKIDNMVQVAHNVKIGENSVIVAQVGIAGSTTVGSNVMIGGQAGLSDHINIADNTMLAARSGIMADTGPGAFSGSPAIPRVQYGRLVVLFNKLPEINRRITELERKLDKTQRSHGNDDD